MYWLLYLQGKTLKRVPLRGFQHEVWLKISSSFLFIFFPARALDFFMLRQLVHFHCFVFMVCQEM